MIRFSKLRRPVVTLIAAALAAGGGMAVPQARSAPAPPQPFLTAGDAVSAAEVGRIFRTNEALADERFRDKPVTVTGRMVRIERVGTGPGNRVAYALIMAPDGAVDPQTGARIGSHPLTLLSFRFTDEVRTALAKLRPGQLVTAAGQCGGYTAAKDGQDTVYVFASRLVRTDE